MRFLLLLLFGLSLYGNGFTQAEAYFNNEEYEKAMPIYLQCTAESKKPEAAYKLGWMYQNAKGVPLDLEKSTQWYKKAAEWEVRKTNRKHLYQTIFGTMNPLSDNESTDTAVQFISGKFSLRANEPNYMLVTYLDTIPRGETKYEQNSPSPNPNGEGYIHTELEYQISLRADYVTRLFGFPQVWSAAYTQTAYWQVFLHSAPFREINYKPELFVALPLQHKTDIIGLKSIIFGYKHASNGQPVTDGNRTRPDGPVAGSRSRSWNRIYAAAVFQWENMFTKIKLWHRISEQKTDDDNPDIEKYYGQGSIQMTYIYKKLLARVTLHPSITKGIASSQLDISYPTYISDDVFFYIKGFSGYGSSLIDYDNKVNKIGFGLSISR